MIYLDSAAVVKLAHAEAESPALRAWLDGRAETGWVSSVLTEIESFRALARYAPDAVSRLPAVLDQIELIDLDPPIQILACRIRSKPFDTPSNAIQNVRREQHRQRRSRELAHRGPGGHRRAGQLAMPGAHPR
jgi:predicted nucleic acid-binding protein